MFNLLAENYRRLFKGKRFYIVLAVIVGVAVLFTLLYYFLNSLMTGIPANELEGVEVQVENSKLYADSLLFTLKSDMPLLIGITAGMLIVQDFRNNTIRNKIIIGHSRTNIYLCTFIVSQTVMLIYEAAYFVTAALVGGIVLGFDKFPSGDMVGQLLMTLPVQMALTSIIVFFCNTMKNIGGFVLSITMTYIVGIFSIALGLLNKFPKAQELVGEIVPTLQMNMILSSDGVPEHAARMIVFMIAITVVSTISGIFLFRRSDLK
ncbi:ABC transporter permease [uncultured Ruminococcus sp.]|uniref:ABC transporter permease n=1 Tax=uncultured Ruminococcus sp. TaxID=165186 RepID=UPI00261D69F9|nr:ABC transporter permease [uncultured Ruminococcus sp.]